MTSEAQSNGEDRKTEVVPKAQRRQFTAAYKARILEEADRCTKPGELGALQRREGLYASSIRRWRKARDAGQLEGLAPHKRGPKPPTDAALVREVVQLRKTNERLQKKLKQAELVIEVQKKVSQLLGISLEESDGHQPGGSK